MSDRKSKKRKLNADRVRSNGQNGIDTSKPSAVFKPTIGRQHTLSIALPSSIIANALTHDQKTALAGQVARACAVYCVDEVVIFDDGQAPSRSPEEGGYTAFADPNFFIFHVLSYLETPPNLRRPLFPMHPDLRTAGSLPSLDMPHHLRSDEVCAYREGIAIKTPAGFSGQGGTLIDCGLKEQVRVPVELDVNTRVTVKLPVDHRQQYQNVIDAEAVSPDMPREESGYYWGYKLRQASSLSNIFTECPYDGGYDVSIGTSERGMDLASLLDPNSRTCIEPTWSHLLLAFGGVGGLEPAFAADHQLSGAGADQVSEVFDHWVNLVPGQGSRTIRSEEAVWIGLAALRPLVQRRDTA